MSMPRLYIKNSSDLKQALSNIALSVAMLDTAVSSIYAAEARKLALIGEPGSPLIENTLNGDQPLLTIKDIAAINKGGVRLIDSLNALHSTLSVKYGYAASAYIGHDIKCALPECQPSSCPCPTDCKEQDCDCIVDHGPACTCPCDTIPAPDPTYPCDSQSSGVSCPCDTLGTMDNSPGCGCQP